MRIQIIAPFEDREPLSLGDRDGMRRQVFLLVNQRTAGAEHLVAGLTVFEPGQGSSLHSHPSSEEVAFAVRGSGIVFSDGESRRFRELDCMFIPEGVEHRHFNDCGEPLWLLFIYGPPGQLPTT